MLPHHPSRLSPLLLSGLAIALALGASSCTGTRPVTVSREALGTVVTVTAYGDDRRAVEQAVEGAYAAIAQVESQTNAYDAKSPVAAFNRRPYLEYAMPESVVAIHDATEELGVSDAFSLTLGGVSRLYHFDTSGTVPASADLALALRAASEHIWTDPTHMSFVRLEYNDARLNAGGELAPALDVAGASKGLALDRARNALKASGSVTGAIVSSGSSTVTFGKKPDGSAWRIGIEDPRDPNAIVATFDFAGDGALSTSGDYQRYFEADGVRYHHILDPATGLPARGIRSLTIAGSSLSGLQSDILSTALFVRGTTSAQEYAKGQSLALYVVDTEGRALSVPAPADSGLSVAEKATPRP